MTQVVIKWHHKTVNPEQVHTGQPIDKASAEAWLKQLNNDWPSLHHWIETVPDSLTDCALTEPKEKSEGWDESGKKYTDTYVCLECEGSVYPCDCTADGYVELDSDEAQRFDICSYLMGGKEDFEHNLPQITKCPYCNGEKYIEVKGRMVLCELCQDEAPERPTECEAITYPCPCGCDLSFTIEDLDNQYNAADKAEQKMLDEYNENMAAAYYCIECEALDPFDCFCEDLEEDNDFGPCKECSTQERCAAFGCLVDEQTEERFGDWTFR